MIDKVKMEVYVYISVLFAEIEKEGIFDELCEDLEIEDRDKFKDILQTILSFKSSVNFEESGIPDVDEDQYEESIKESFTEYILEEMLEEGTIIKDFDPSIGENIYKLNS